MSSRFWTIAIVATYVLIYKLWEIYQNYRKFGTWYSPDVRLVKEEVKILKNQGFQLYLSSELHRIYAKRFRNDLAKGKSSESFYQKLEKDLRRDKAIAKWYWLLGVVVVLAFAIPVYLKDPLVDSFIFTVIESVLVFPIVFFFKRSLTSGFPVRERLLEEAAVYQNDLKLFFTEDG